jgi:AcrR family transcriptional regulator
LFAERGFHGTGIRDIATQAQTTLSSLYHHCGSKDDLLVDIMLSSTQPLLDAAQRVVAAFPSPATQLAMLIEQHVWAHATDRLAKLIADTEIRALTGERRENVLVIRDSYEALWREAIKQGNQTHAFDTPNPTVAAITLLEMCTSVSHWYRPEGSLPLDELCRLYADHGLALVRAATNGVPTRRAALTLPEPTHFLHG